jgi:hypothetical protein
VFSPGTQCFRHPCQYFHSFAQGDAPTNWRQAPQPPMGKSNNSAAERTCSREPCKKDAHGSCTNKACKFCCVVLGGCSIKGHNEAALSQAQLSKLVALKGASSHNPLTSPPLTTPLRYAPSHFPLDPRLTAQPERSSEELAWLLSKPKPVSHMQQEEESNSIKQQEEVEREAELERLEDEEYRRVVTESLSLLSSTSAALSPSASSQVIPPASEPSTSILVQGLPVTRVNSSNYPTITSHLSDDWMRRHEDRTKVPQAIRKGQVDSELIKRFRVVWWSKLCIYTVYSHVLTLIIGWHESGDDSHPQLRYS